MLLVDDDQARFRQGSEDGQARAGNDSRGAAQGCPPVPVARGFPEFAMETDQPGSGKTRHHPRLELWRQVDLRHQQQRLPSGSEGTLDQAQIDLGLAAAGDAMQQVGVKPGAAGRDRGQRHFLFGGQGWRRDRPGVVGQPPDRPGLRWSGRAQAGGQGGQHGLAHRNLVIGGAELDQAEPVSGQGRQVAQHYLAGSELG